VGSEEGMGVFEWFGGWFAFLKYLD